MTITTLVLSITGVFGGGGGSASPLKDKEALKKWLNRLADALKRLPVMGFEALPAIVGSAVGAILSFLGKTVRFASKHA